MDFAQKMFLVPQHQMDKLKNSTAATPSIRKTVENDMDAAIRHILARTDIDPHEKIKLYTVALQRFLALVKQGDQETSRLTLTLPQPESEESDVSSLNSSATYGRAAAAAEAFSVADVDYDDDDVIKSDVLKHVPLRSRKNASFILEKITKPGSAASWNDKGEFIYKGKMEHGSHMVDLVKNVTAPYNVSDDRRPPGWSSFLRAMADLNMPYSAIPNKLVRGKIGQFKENTADEDTKSFASPRFPLFPRLSPFSPRAFQTPQSSKWDEY